MLLNLLEMNELMRTRRLLNERGMSVFVEYFVLSAIIAIATIAFFNDHLKTEGTGARAQIEQAVDNQITNLIVAPPQNRMNLDNSWF